MPITITGHLVPTEYESILPTVRERMALGQLPVLLTRTKEQHSLIKIAQQYLPIRLLKARPDSTIQIVHVVQMVAQALYPLRPLDIALASKTDITAAASGFAIPDKQARPYIVISKGKFDVADSKFLLDAYAGFAAHESGHLLYSKNLISMLLAERKKGIWLTRALVSFKTYTNIWEDDRMERRLAQDVPATIPYLEAARAFFIDRELTNTAKEWQNLDEIDKYRALFFAFVRSPLRLLDTLPLWHDVTGHNPIDDFECHFAKPPETEEDVFRYAKQIIHLLEVHRTKYPQNAEQLLQWLETHDPDAVDCSRITAQLYRDILNAHHKECTEDSTQESCITDEINSLRNIPRKSGVRSKTFKCELAAVIKQLEMESPTSPREGTVLSQGIISKFLRASGSIVSQGFSRNEINMFREQIQSMTATTFEVDGVSVPVIPVTTHEHPVLYDTAVKNLENEIKVLKMYIRRLTPTDCRHEILHQRRRGKIDPRHLARALYSEHIFRTISHAQPLQEKEIVLLLDQSGSIVLHRQTVFNAVVFLVEGFRDASGFRLAIYSHSTEESDEPVVYSYNEQKDHREVLGEYVHAKHWFRNNYDNYAIQTVAAVRNVKTGTSRKRLLVVVSDGLPCGMNGIEKTREAVEQLRRKNWRVINVAIGTQGNFDKIYGKEYTAQSSTDGLAHNLGRIVLRELQGL